MMSRILDIIFSGIGLVVLIPLLVPLCILLRFTGEGQVFFVQKRVGRNEKVFGLIKFATMLLDSPNIGTGTLTVKNDPRILPIGNFLRKTKFNELPQLLNILFGDMSIIGPRPQTLRCFQAFPKVIHSTISSVRPGLSGIGSIIFRDEDNLLDSSNDPNYFYDKVIMPYKGDLEGWYVKRRNIAIDLTLILLTLWVVLFPKSKIAWRLFPDLPLPPDGLFDLPVKKA